MTHIQDELVAAASGIPDAPKTAASTADAPGMAIDLQLSWWPESGEIAEAWRTVHEARQTIQRCLDACDASARALVRKHPRLLPVLFPQGE